jgi:hypothetical protein
MYIYGRDSSVRIATDHVLDGRGSITGQGQEIFLYSTATDSEAHPASYTIRTGVRAVGEWIWPLTSN